MIGFEIRSLVSLPLLRGERSPSPISEELRNQLNAIYEEFSQIPGFPYADGECDKVGDYLEGLGLKRVTGYFQAGDNGAKDHRHAYYHEWGTKGRHIIELTGQQFNPYLPPDEQFPLGVVILPPDDIRARRYKPGTLRLIWHVIASMREIEQSSPNNTRSHSEVFAGCKP